MTTRASLQQLFGSGAAQDNQSLTISTRGNLTAEGALVELINRLFSYSDFALETEDGAALASEGGGVLRGEIRFERLELDRLPTQFRAGDRIDRFFIGLNREDI